MKGDRELCMAVVAQKGWALECASQEMKGDRELCTAAVTEHGFAFAYASDEIKKDASFVKALLEPGRNCAWQVFSFASASLKDDEGIVLAAIASFLKQFPDEQGRMMRATPVWHCLSDEICDPPAAWNPHL